MLEGLEHLRPEWTKMLRQAERRLYAPGEEAYSERLWEFEVYLENAEFDPVGGEDIADEETVGGNGTCADKSACGKKTADKNAACADSEPGHLTWEILGEQLMMFFVYTYFCGSVYDDMVSAKMGLAVLSVTWIKELCMLSWLENEKTLSFEQVVETAYCFAREVEHSDDNLNMLEEWLDGGYEEAREVTAGNRRKR